MSSNRDLVTLIRAGDHFAYRQIFELYAKRVYAFAFSIVRHKQSAEDITQESFKKLWEKRHMLNPDKSLHGIFFTFVYHEIIDDLRKNKRRRELLNGNNTTDFSSVNSDDLIITNQLNSFYQQAVNKLPGKRKEIFLLSRHEGLSNNQIASQLNISTKTVENQMTAALRSLKEFLKDFNLLIFIF